MPGCELEHVPLAEVKNRLSEVVDRLEREHGRVVITKHGRPVAVMLSLEDLEGMHSAHRATTRSSTGSTSGAGGSRAWAIAHRADVYRRG
jgi:prevent-host-death family protein